MRGSSYGAASFSPWNSVLKAASEALLYLILLSTTALFATTEPWSVAVMQILIAGHLILTALLGDLRLDGKARRILAGTALAVPLMGLVQLTSLQPGDAPNLHFFSTTSSWATQTAVLLWLSYFTLIVTTCATISDSDKAKRLAWAILAIGTISALTGIAFRNDAVAYEHYRQTYRYPMLGFRELTHRGTMPFGTFVNRDHAAFFLALCAAVGIGILSQSISDLRRLGSSARIGDAAAKAVMALCGIATIIYGLLETGSRGGMFSLGIGAAALSLVTIAAFTGPKARWKLLALVFLVGGGGVYLIYQNPYYHPVRDGAWIPQLLARFSFYESGWQLIRDQFPQIGTGLGAFRYASAPYQPEFIAGRVLTHLHCDWLQILVELGIVGLAIVGVGFAAAFGTGIKTWVSSSRKPNFIAGGALLALITAAIHMCLEFPLRTSANAILLILAAGLFLPPRGKIKDSRPASWGGRRAKSRLFAGVVISWAALLLIGSIPPLVSEFHFHRGKKTPPESQVYFFSRALSWSENPQYAVHLARAYIAMADTAPSTRVVLLRKGLQVIDPFFRLYPIDINVRRTHAAIMRRLR
ncbi:MAG: hypothetical protein CO113_14210 [Elusimicrobia bacterium CG_4_9_14_3_um_filter_62_55]|nr:MAG: hypothetical protein COR54_19555 [Elusimicrobia bacterium CG22_combo_CG10-13_8_21_14_all_63_91]PJB24398.1 MAG: hypothetical protein CO113_14210 [Elusimicrobia bacterium CG_4_9_14_3_um_filter_62_55]